MTVGVQVDKAAVNLDVGALAAKWNDLLTQTKQAQAWAARTTQADLQAIGFGEDEAYLVLVALQEIGGGVDVLRGAAEKTGAVDLTANLAKLWGIGITGTPVR